MSAYPAQGPMEEKKPGFLRRPVPMWAFLLLVIILVVVFFLPVFFTPPLQTLQQPLFVTPDSRTLFVNVTSITANFTVVNLNSTDTITATATATLWPANANIALTMSGVQTRNTFVASSDGKTVSFPTGASTLIVSIRPNGNMKPLNYTVQVSLTD